MLTFCSFKTQPDQIIFANYVNAFELLFYQNFLKIKFFFIYKFDLEIFINIFFELYLVLVIKINFIFQNNLSLLPSIT